jgi:hypothetical protein
MSRFIGKFDTLWQAFEVNMLEKWLLKNRNVMVDKGGIHVQMLQRELIDKLAQSWQLKNYLHDLHLWASQAKITKQITKL